MKAHIPLLICATALLLPACSDDSSSTQPAAAQHPKPACMPERDYKVGPEALADIRSIYETASRRRGFAGDKTLKQLEHYLFHADSMQQQDLDALLFAACDFNCPGLVAELIERGANVNATIIYWDLLDGEEESSRFSYWTPLHKAALPCFYKGGATAEKAIRIIDMLLAAGANPKLGDSPLPYVARMEHDKVHFEEVFLHLLDCGLSLDEERTTPEITAEHRDLVKKHGGTLDKARITPAHRAQVFDYLKYLRELSHPWKRAEERLGVPP